MKKKLFNIGKYLLFLGIGVFLVWWSLHKIPSDKWDDFQQSLRTANYWLLLPVFFILSASHVLRSLRWQIIIGTIGSKPKLPNTFFAVMIGYLANLAVPRLGEVLKCTILAKYEHVPADKLVGTIVAERAVDVICLGLVFLLAFLVQYDLVYQFAVQLMTQINNQFTHLPTTLIAIGIVVVIGFFFVAKILAQKYKHIKPVAFVLQIGVGIWQGFSAIRNIRQKGLFFLYTLLIWLMYIGGTWVGLYATQGTAHLGVQHAIAALAFASIGMIITPGGIGAYAFFLAKVLEKNGVPFEIGFANGTLQWFAQFLIVVLVGFVCLMLLPVYNKSKTI